MGMRAGVAPPRRRLSKSARRAQLLAVAEAVFGERGYQGATMELIAARADVTRSLLYEHFASLDEVYLECVRYARAELDARFLDASVLNQGSPHDQLRAGIRAYFGFVRDHGEGWEVLFGGGPAPDGEVGRIATELRFRTVDQIAALFHVAVPGVDAGRTRAYAHAVSGAGEQLARWWRQNPGVELDEVVEHLMVVAWHGLAAFVEGDGEA
jgi:AcrR family transcriptional regulator